MTSAKRVNAIFSSSDINECDITKGGCDDICNNTPGSFTCSCNEGRTLGADGKTCTEPGMCL